MTGPATASAMRPATVTAPLPPEVVADALRAEQEAYLRRLGVCSELRRVGLDTNDDALIRQADELERQAATVYNQRVAALGVPKVKAPLPETTPGGFGGAYLPVDPKAAADRLTAPAAPTSLPGTAGASAPRPDQIREVRP
jgi:hypothetical protein